MAHVELEEFKDLHQDGKPPGNEKGCLWEHQGKFKPGDHCSHRWQARVKAESDPTVYNYPAYASLCVDHAPDVRRPEDTYLTAGYRGPTAPQPKRYRMLMVGKPPVRKRPRPGQWDLSNPFNFAESATKPYWQNAHHIIPNATLVGTIENVGQNADIILLMKQGLLRGDYSLNDPVNLIILPMDRAVATALGLPRHLKGDQAQPHEKEPGEKRRMTDHPDFRRRVSLRLVPILTPYKTLAENAKKDAEKKHDTPSFRLSKAQLDVLSRQTYESIKRAGPFLKGKSTDELKFGGVGNR